MKFSVWKTWESQGISKFQMLIDPEYNPGRIFPHNLGMVVVFEVI